MADGLSIAASAIQVADAGLKLYGALSQYIRDYVDANKHVRRLADEVRTTSWALQQLGALLKEDDDIKLCKPEAIGETEAALKGCQRAFDQVSDIIKGFLPPSKPDGSSGLARSSISNRWKWPLKTAKVQLLLAQLERLKTTLLLIFKVITYASKLASKTSQKEIFLPDEKSQLLYLLKAKQDAIEVEEKLLTAIVQQPPSMPIVKPEIPSGAYGQHDSRLRTNKTPFDSVDSAPVSRGISESTDQPLTYPGLTSAARAEPTPPPMPYTNFVGAVLLPEQFEIPKRSLSLIHNHATRPKEPPRLSRRKRGLVARLDDCVAAVERLTRTLNQAKEELQSDECLGLHHVTRSFRSTKRAIDALVSTEMDADSDSATSDRGLGTSLPMAVVGGLAGARLHQRGTNEPQFDFYGSSIDRSQSRRSKSRSRREVTEGPSVAPAGGLAQASVAGLYERVTIRPYDEPQLGAYAYAKPSALIASDTTQKNSDLSLSSSDFAYDTTAKQAGTRPGHETGEVISSNPPSGEITDETQASTRKKPTTFSSVRSAFRFRETGLQRRQLVRSPEALAEYADAPNSKDDSSTVELRSTHIAELEWSAPGDARRAKTTSSIAPLDNSQNTPSRVGTRPQRPLGGPTTPSSYREETSMTGLNHSVSTGILDGLSPNNATANPAPGVARILPPSLSPADLGLAPSSLPSRSRTDQVFAAGSTEHAVPPVHLESIACDDDIDEDAWSLKASYDIDSLDLGLETGEGKARSMKASLVRAQDSPESKAVDTTNPRGADGLTLDRDRMSFGDVERRRVVSRSDEYYQLPPRVMENMSPETYDVVESEEDNDMDGGPEAEGDICEGAEEEGDMEGGPEEEGDICDGAEGESDIEGGAEEDCDMDGGAEEESADVAYETYDSVGSGENSDTEGNGEEESEDMVDALVRRWTTVPI
ncbi:DNA-binding transcription factor [Friedmanniomyces endolithicus]|nr:DNA-binding transcription factor [Friedmanniomyces endolithicus]